MARGLGLGLAPGLAPGLAHGRGRGPAQAQGLPRQLLEVRHHRLV